MTQSQSEPKSTHAITLLSADHREIEELFETFETATTTVEQRHL